VGAGDDVGSHETIPDPLTGIGTGAHGGIDGTGLTTNHDGDIATTDEFTGHQGDFCRLGHGVSRLNRRDETAGFNHAEGDALH